MEYANRGQEGMPEKPQTRIRRTTADGAAPIAGTSRATYLAGCQAIAELVSPVGYTYARSGPRLTRRAGEFVFEISFQSSHHNQTGKNVTLWLHALVRSPALKRWRAAHPCLRPGSDLVAGGQIGNLSVPTTWLAWNLALTDRRDQQIADAVATLKRLAYPYFALFEDRPALRRRLAGEDIPAVHPGNLLDWLMSDGRPAEALQAARGFYQRLPDMPRLYPAALARFRAEGLPVYQVTAYAETLAAATVLYEFPDLAAEAAAEAGNEA